MMEINDMYDYLIIGCGLTGMVIARELAENDYKVLIIEKRNHIGGNMYDYIDHNGLLVQKYGPHVFFTDNENIEKYVTKFIPVEKFYPECRTYISGEAIPMPFNFNSIDIIYPDKNYAAKLKEELEGEFGINSIVSVLDVINSKNDMIHDYGMYMYENEYKKYTAKQWNKNIDEIEPSVFMRVPVYISEKKPYLKEKYQFMPVGGFTKLAKSIINHPNITVSLEENALDKISIDEQEKKIVYDHFYSKTIIYTGPLDALFSYRFGELPYRALEFTWKVIKKQSAPKTPLSAYPEGDKYIRITDYSQFPPQEFGDNALIAIEYPFEYKRNELCGNEPYYPTLTKESKKMFKQYKSLANEYQNLLWCGRLAEFKYFNMDSIIENALDLAKNIIMKDKKYVE